MKFILISLFAMMLFASTAQAHFGMLIPSETMVVSREAARLELQLLFAHPFERSGMDLELPRAFGVLHNGKKQDLLATLQETRILGAQGWKARYRADRPALMQFYVEPRPYWEASEDKYILHYTKTVVTAFGEEEGWDEPIGLPMEIVPLSRPYGLYAGNLFQGRVLKDGKPVPFAEVEIEPYPQGKLEALNDYMVTQVVKADAAGSFSYAAPKAGWWGFAALSRADEGMMRDGEEKEVELGAVIWVRFESFPEGK